MAPRKGKRSGYKPPPDAVGADGPNRYDYENITKVLPAPPTHSKPPWQKMNLEESPDQWGAESAMKAEERKSFSLDRHCRVLNVYRGFESNAVIGGHVGFQDTRAFTTFLDTQGIFILLARIFQSTYMKRPDIMG